MTVRTAVMSGDQRPLANHWKVLFPQLAITNDVLVIKLKPRHGFQDRNTWRAVCPTTLRRDVIKAAHSSIVGGHGGILKTMERIKADFYWPGMDPDVDDFLKNCQICQEYSNKYPAQTTGPQRVTLTTQPNEIVHSDLYGPLKDNTSSNNYVIVITCAFTKFVQIAALPGKESEVVAQAILDNWIYRFGVMKTLMTDQGTEYCNSLQDKLCDLLQINRRTTSPFFPQCNSQAETFNKTMSHYLRTTLGQENKSKLDWKMYLAPLQFSYNTAVSRATKTSPFKALLNYPARAPIWPNMDILLEKDYQDVKKGKSRDFLHDWSQLQQETRNTVHQNNEHDQDIRLRAAEKKSDSSRNSTTNYDFKENDLIWIWICAKPQPNPKLGAKWYPGVVINRNSATTFNVSRTDTKRKRKFVLNGAYIKHKLDAHEDEPEEAIALLAALLARRSRFDTLERAIHRDRPTPERLLYWRRRLLRLHQPPMLVGLWNRIHQQQLTNAAARLIANPPPSPPPSSDDDNNSESDEDDEDDEFYDMESQPTGSSSNPSSWDEDDDESWDNPLLPSSSKKGNVLDDAQVPPYLLRPSRSTSSWEDDTTNESTTTDADLDRTLRRANRLRDNIARAEQREEHRQPSPRRSPRKHPPNQHFLPNPPAPARTQQQQALLDQTGQDLERLSSDFDRDRTRIATSRSRLARAIRRIHQPAPDDDILLQCRTTFTPPPLATRRLGPAAEIDYYMSHLRTLVADLGLQEDVLPHLAERLRSNLKTTSK